MNMKLLHVLRIILATQEKYAGIATKCDFVDFKVSACDYKKALAVLNQALADVISEESRGANKSWAKHMMVRVHTHIGGVFSDRGGKQKHDHEALEKNEFALEIIKGHHGGAALELQVTRHLPQLNVLKIRFIHIGIKMKNLIRSY